MKNFSLKALGATLIAAALVVFGAAIPAHAAAATLSVSSFTANTAAGFTFSTGTISASTIGSLDVKVYNNSNQPTTFAPVSGCNTFAACNVTSLKLGSTTFSQEGTVGLITVSVLGTVAANNYSQSHILFSFSGTGVSVTSNTIEVVFGNGALTASNTNGSYTFQADLSASSMTQYTAAVSVSGATTAVRFYRNYNSSDNTSTTQSSATQAPLTLNSFSNPGLYFQGWATSRTGAVVYKDGDPYAFTSPAFLYAVWGATAPESSSGASTSSDTLASTGFDAAPYLSTGAVLALAGAVLILFARRRQSS